MRGRPEGGFAAARHPADNLPLGDRLGKIFAALEGIGAKSFRCEPHLDLRLAFRSRPIAPVLWGISGRSKTTENCGFMRVPRLEAPLAL